MAKCISGFNIRNRPIVPRQIRMTNNVMPVSSVHDLTFSTFCLENALKLRRELTCLFH